MSSADLANGLRATIAELQRDLKGVTSLSDSQSATIIRRDQLITSLRVGLDVATRDRDAWRDQVVCQAATIAGLRRNVS